MGGGYEVTSDGVNTTVRKYYAIAGQTYGMNDNGVMKYFLTDHLSSTVAVTDASGTLLEESRYLPFGQVRSDVGNITSTDKTYTGQKDLANTGLMDYNARMYSPELGRFIQPDTIVPGATNSQAWNRFSYTQNNPINFTDPSGHDRDCGIGDQYCDSLKHEYGNNWREQLNNPTKKNVKPSRGTLGGILEQNNGGTCGYETLGGTFMPTSNGRSYASYGPPTPSDYYTIFDSSILRTFEYTPFDLSKTNFINGYEDLFGHSGLRYDLSKVPWGDVAIDVIGIIGDFIPIVLPGAESIEAVKAFRDINMFVDLGKVSNDFVYWSTKTGFDTDIITTALDGASLVPWLGAVPSGLGILYSLGKGFYIE